VDIIEVKLLTKRFDGLVAVDHVSFTVGKGEIFGFLGPNGAGKSTTISMLATILTPSEGDATISGQHPPATDAVRHSLPGVPGCLLDNRHSGEPAVPRACTACRSYYCRHARGPPFVDLGPPARFVETFSGGMKRLEIAWD
jgi:energy-coupling factor transporter ATP-binding protein EcfA2